MHHHERLKHIKEQVLCCVEEQMCNLEDTDTKELGEAIDILKDLEEAIYYSTITEAMKGEDTQQDRGDYEWSAKGVGEYGYPLMSDHWSMHKDGREGRSPEVRRMYMEARDMGKDKTMQIKELEHYMQELSTDIVEMIQEAGPEEKQYLEKKLLALASKIGQMK